MRHQRNLPVLAVAVPAAAAGYDPQALDFGGDGGESEHSGGMSIKQIASIVWAYRKWTAGIFLAIVIPVILVAKFVMPKYYSATATLMVDYNVSDPLAGKNGNAALMMNYMSTRVQLMQSSEVLVPVIQRLHLNEDRELAGNLQRDPKIIMEAVKESVSKNIDIEQGAFGSQLLNVTATARDPVKAAEIANTVSEVYAEQELNRQAGPATERATRYTSQIAELKAKVNSAQEQVTAFRQRTGVTADVQAANSVDVDLLNSLEMRYLDAQNLRRAAEVKAMSDHASSATYLTSNSVQGLKAKVETLESQLAQMSATLGEMHPKVKEIKAELKATRESLATESQTYTSSVGTDVASTRQLEEKLHDAVETQRVKVLNVRRLQDEGTKYALELESAQSVYKRALDGYDEIMFASGGHSTNVTFVSRAVPPLRASKPNKIKILLMAIVAGLGLGVVGPLVYELFVNRRLRCADDMERTFRIPVLVEFDAIPELVRSA